MSENTKKNPVVTTNFSKYGKVASFTTGLLGRWATPMLEVTVKNLPTKDGKGGFVRETTREFIRNITGVDIAEATQEQLDRRDVRNLQTAYGETSPLRFQGSFSIKYGGHDVVDINMLSERIVANLGGDIVDHIKNGRMTVVNVDENALPTDSQAQALDCFGYPMIAHVKEQDARGRWQRVYEDGKPIVIKTTDLEMAQDGYIVDRIRGYWVEALSPEYRFFNENRIADKTRDLVEIDAPELVNVRRIHKYDIDLENLRRVVSGHRRMSGGSRLTWGKDNKHFAGLVVVEERISETETRSKVVATVFGVMPDSDCEKQLQKKGKKHQHRKFEDQIGAGFLGKGRIFIMGPLAHKVILGSVDRYVAEILPTWLTLNPPPVPSEGMPKEAGKPKQHKQQAAATATIGDLQALKSNGQTTVEAAPPAPAAAPIAAATDMVPLAPAASAPADPSLMPM